MTHETTHATSKLAAAEQKLYLKQPLFKQKATSNAASATTIQRRPQQESSLLSFVQEGIWYLEQLQPDKATYNMPSAWYLYGPLNVAALERAFNALLQRHETLRTRFHIIDDQPVQIIAPDLTLTIKTIDLRHLADQEQETHARHLVEEEGYKPFDLTQAPLLRVTLIQLAAEKHIFLLNIHHIISDAWSMGILTQELSTLYASFVEQQPQPELPPLSIQYADFAIWQREQVQSETLQKDTTYWREQLAGAPPLLELPTDYIRPATQSYKGDKITGQLPADLVQSLEQLSIQQNASLFMTLLTAFNILLYRYTGQDDIVVGAPMINRRYIETENLIGYFLNNLALRTNIVETLTFAELLNLVRQTTLEAYSHQALPFEKLVQELQPQRDLSYAPIFQLFFNMFTTVHDENFTLANLEIEPFIRHEVEVGSKFDITLYVRKHEEDVYFNLVYKTSLFHRERMETMLAQYVQLLHHITHQPHRPIAELSLVTPQTQSLLPDPAAPLSDTWHGAVHQQFARMAQLYPHKDAIVDPHDTWSYQELDQRSNQLAHCLIAQGIQPGDVVAIYGHRSASLIWAWLGVLKAGGALVNLDPAYPTDRLLHYLDFSQAKAIIQLDAAGPLPDTVAEVAATLACHLSLPNLSLALQHDPLTGYLTTDPDITVDPDDTASITFTSGSTGLPKGVRGRYGPLSHFLPWQTEAFNLSPADHFSMLSGLAHDPLQRDIFTALWVGATIHIPDPDRVGTPGYLAGWMQQHAITFAHMTPPMGQILTETATNDATLPQLRYAFFVGDKLTRQDVSQLQHLAPNVTCINSYGSTETQRAVGYHCIPPTKEHNTAANHSRAVYPLGKGMPDAQLLVLNAQQQLAGIGEVGEIYLRSPHLAGGYVGDEALTEARFITNPFTNLPHDRLYRTGDLGRYRPDGLVEFAGRTDRQIKIRGFRVEPGEVEHALAQHPHIKQAIVIARDDLPGGLGLVAYVVPEIAAALAPDDLRMFLKAHFPDHMVPVAYVQLDTMPLTPNGKINYRALPSPDVTDIKATDTFVSPRNPTEQQVTDIWQQLLQRNPISIHDNFFELGGHSLLAIRLFTQIEHTFGKKLPLTILFQSPTIAELAHVIAQNEVTIDAPTLVPIQPGLAKPPFFCVHGFGGGVVGYGELARLLGSDQPVYGLQAKGIDGDEEPDTDVETMATRYVEAIRTVQPHGPYYVGGYCYGGVVAYEMACQLEAQGDVVNVVAIFEGYAPLRGQNRDAIWRNPKLIMNFMHNMPYWLFDYLTLSREQMWQRAARKVRSHGKNVMRKLGLSVAQSANDVIDDTRHLSADHLLMMEAQIRAMSSYNPGLYNGKVTLFRTRSQSLSRTPDFAMGWQKLAGGGVDVRRIAGSHHNILEQPHVQTLAMELKKTLH
ncbi:MAG: amino acid adenylation domain-containing protein [Anaerolineae bacterium]|nr:amino acid adenylation domain-containing protein [Anaerolineae bacterium]